VIKQHILNTTSSRPSRPIRTRKGTVAEVKQFWDEQARTFEASQLATDPNTHGRDLEIRTILARLPAQRIRVLDVGCGNGFSTIQFAKARPQATFFGIDYSKEMIKHARSVLAKQPSSVRTRLNFQQGNILSIANQLSSARFDYIVSQRCIINLQHWGEQRRAILQLRLLLKRNGRILLAENTQEGLNRLNTLRVQFGLKPISVRWHNRYLPEKRLLPFLEQGFVVEDIDNFGNLYYIISRVVYAALAAREGKEPEYDHPINDIAAKLPSLGKYRYSPSFLFVLRNGK
jgi:SAM-dependent methyltransferase